MKFDEEFSEDILNSTTRMNDKELIKRIFINSRDDCFNYYDSLNILKNKPFLMVQLIFILFGVTFLSLITLAVDFPYVYVLLLGTLVYIFLIYSKFTKIEKKVRKIDNDNNLNILKEQIVAKWEELFILMQSIPIDLERIEYNRKKFRLEIGECITKEDFERVLDELLREIEKYKSVSGFNESNSKEEQTLNYLSDSIKNAYFELNLPPGSNFKEVKAKYRELMKKYHPDSSHSNSDKASKINNAYTVLKDFLGEN